MSDFKQSSPKPKPFNCYPAWHLQTSGLCLAIYNVVGAISGYGKRTYFTSQKRMSEYLGRNYSSVQKAFTSLRRLGWLEWKDPLKGKASEIKEFRYISHDEWVKTHPDKCCKRDLLPWQDQQTDPLVGRLYAICSGKLRVYEWQVAGLRKLATSDDEICLMLEAAVTAAKVKQAAKQWSNTSPKSCLWQVRQALEEKARERKKVLEDF